MTRDLTPEEWSLLADAPLAAAAAIALAEAGGARRETDALLQAWREGAALFPNSPLVQRLARDFDPQQRAQGGGGRPGEALPPAPEAIQVEAVGLCRRAIDVLARAVAAPEVEAYKGFVMSIAAAVAGAAQSGGIMGLGGVTVTMNERDALRAIRLALDYTPPELRL
jgi:hypothetical protein